MTSEVKGNDPFFKRLLDSLMSGNMHDMLTNFLKLETTVFFGSKTKDAYKFILDYYERLHKLGIVHNYMLEFMSFKHQSDFK